MNNVSIARIAGNSNKNINKNNTERAEFVTATKELVDELLDMNDRNRNIRPANVKYLTKEMLSGNWSVSNQGIGVSIDGHIIDGGHRLHAMRKAGYPPVRFLLVTGLPIESQKYVDQHAKRTLKDTLKLFMDREFQTNITGAMNAIYSANNNWVWGEARISPDEMINMIELRQDAINLIMDIKKIKTLTVSVIGAIIEQLYQTNDVRILSFVKNVIEGEMLEKGDPALTFRNWMIAKKGQAGGSFYKEKYLRTTSIIERFLQGDKIYRMPPLKTTKN